MKHFFITTLIAITATFGSTAKAMETNDSLRDHIVLINTARGIGLEYKTNHEECVNDKMHIYGWWSPRNRMVVVCQNNHSSKAEIGDTIRHEYIHVVQTCKGGPIYPDQTFNSDMSKDIYPEKQYQTEAEARFLATTMSPIEIAQEMIQACILDK